jgi:hypothetical protein
MIREMSEPETPAERLAKAGLRPAAPSGAGGLWQRMGSRRLLLPAGIAVLAAVACLLALSIGDGGTPAPAPAADPAEVASPATRASSDEGDDGEPDRPRAFRLGPIPVGSRGAGDRNEGSGSHWSETELSRNPRECMSRPASRPADDSGASAPAGLTDGKSPSAECPPGIEVSCIVRGLGGPTAIINNTLVQSGSSIAGFTVVDIGEFSVELARDGRHYIVGVSPPERPEPEQEEEDEDKGGEDEDEDEKKSESKKRGEK